MSKLFVDDSGRNVACPENPQRIISLCPSLTYSLIQLGGKHKLKGRTRYCVHPADTVQDMPAIGGVFGLKKDAIDELKPDLILAVKEENKKEEVLALAENYPVFVFDVRSVSENTDHLRKLWQLCALDRKKLKALLSAFPEQSFPVSAKRSLYLIWKNPWMGVGPNTYTGSVLAFFGFPQDDFGGTPYPLLTEGQLKTYDRIFLSSEPYPFGEKEQDEMRKRFPDTEVLLVEGEMFSWFGAWFAKTKAYMQGLK